jgi:hypothetical protein
MTRAHRPLDALGGERLRVAAAHDARCGLIVQPPRVATELRARVAR